MLASQLQTELGRPARGELDGDDELARVRMGHDRATPESVDDDVF
jgi:hypothetical protein